MSLLRNPGMPFQVARQRAHEMLDFVGTGRKGGKSDTYSTGMKHDQDRPNFVHDPDHIPRRTTNGLDPKAGDLGANRPDRCEPA